MDMESYIAILTALVGALGVKEIWAIWRKKIDNSHEIEVNQQQHNDKLSLVVIEELKLKIDELEQKIDSLISENIELREKLARMEERLLVNANKKSGRKRAKSTSPK